MERTIYILEETAGVIDYYGQRGEPYGKQEYRDMKGYSDIQFAVMMGTTWLNAKVEEILSYNKSFGGDEPETRTNKSPYGYPDHWEVRSGNYQWDMWLKKIFYYE